MRYQNSSSAFVNVMLDDGQIYELLLKETGKATKVVGTFEVTVKPWSAGVVVQGT